MTVSMTLSTPHVSASNLVDVKTIVNDAMADKHHLEIIASGSKRALGRCCAYDQTVDLTAMTGIIDYQPEELVLTLRAATPIAEIQAVLTKARQILAFEVPDYGHLLNGPLACAGAGTIGGVVATNLSGPRRLTAGAARDYLLGFEAISGRGEAFKSGGKVMKNVTGYDLPKLMTGSFGTLAVMDEITLKTLPQPETSCSLVVEVEDFASATRQIASLFATPHEPGSAAILPADLAGQAGLTVSKGDDACLVIVRLEGISVSIADRLAHLQRLTGGDSLEASASEALWAKIRDVKLFAEPVQDVWKISCPPAVAAPLISTIKAVHEINYFADWAGGLVWMTGGTASLGADVRRTLAGLGSGFAMLVRDAGTARRTTAPFQPLAGPMLELHKRVKAAFDPLAVLNAGRMHDGI